MSTLKLKATKQPHQHDDTTTRRHGDDMARTRPRHDDEVTTTYNIMATTTTGFIWSPPNNVMIFEVRTHKRQKKCVCNMELRFIHKNHPKSDILPIGSMYAIYGNMDPINIPPLC